MNNEFIPMDKQAKSEEASVENMKSPGEEYESFEKEASELRKEHDEQWAIFELTLEGGKELIKIYGSEKFTEAIREAKNKEEERAKIYNSESSERTDMYEIIKILEPNKGKRAELYEEMRKINKDMLENPDNKNDIYGDTKNNIGLRDQAIDCFESLDSLSNLTLENIKKWMMPGWEIGDRRGYFGMTSFENINAEDLKKQLDEYDNNIIGLAMDKGSDNVIKEKELREKRDELKEGLNKEIMEIAKEARIAFYKKYTELIKARELTQMTDSVVGGAGREIIDVAISSIDEILKKHYENVQNEIFEKTKVQRELINKIEKIRLG